MGMCKPSGGIKAKIGKIGNLKAIGEPNTRIDLYNEKGELIQQRWYGPDVRAILNRDWKHKDNNPNKPHKFHTIILGIGLRKSLDKTMIKIEN